jgi:hypothetical protein
MVRSGVSSWLQTEYSIVIPGEQAVTIPFHQKKKVPKNNTLFHEKYPSALFFTPFNIPGILSYCAVQKQ